MRRSNRAEVVDAAFRVIERDGLTALTYEAVAAEAGLTKGGLLYHFPSREALLQGLHERLAEQWEEQLVRSAGKSASEASTAERLEAYVRTTVQAASRADLLLLLEAADPASLSEPWTDVLDRWAPELPGPDKDPEAVARFIVRLAADGLWLHDALAHQTIPADVRQALVDHLANTLAPSATRDSGQEETTT